MNAEKNIPHRFFLEAGYHFIEYGNNFSVKTQNFHLSSSSNLYYTHQLSVGAGHRLQLAKSPIFNIHAGITLGTIQGTIYFNDDFMNPYSFAPYIEFERSSELKSRAFFSAYLGLSKDIHLTNRFILSLSYRKQIGLTGGSVHHFDYTTNAFAGSYRATGTLNGSESSFLVGLKFKLSDK